MRNHRRSYAPLERATLAPARRWHYGLPILVAGCVIIAGTACVSRNVESLSAEEKASMAAPPEPIPEVDRAASVTKIPGVDGTVAVAAEFTGSVPEGVLYVIVRVAGRAQGPPLAVKQLAVELPAEFRISEADSMIPGTPFVGDLDIIVRLDQDGNAFSRQDGDMEGRAGPVQVGGSVQIILRSAEPARSAESVEPAGLAEKAEPAASTEPAESDRLADPDLASGL